MEMVERGKGRLEIHILPEISLLVLLSSRVTELQLEDTGQ